MTPNQRIASDMRERAASLADEYIGVSGELTATEYATRLANHIRSLALPADPASGEGKHDPRSGPCPTCGFHLTTDNPEPFVIHDDPASGEGEDTDETDEDRMSRLMREQDAEMSEREREFLVELRKRLAKAASDVLAARDAEIEALRKLVYVPGLWKCKRCGFTLVQRVLRASDGAVGIRDESGEHCPNDGSPLWRVTERDAGNELADRSQEYLERATKAERERDEIRTSGEGADDPNYKKALVQAFSELIERRDIISARDAEIATLRRLEADARASAAEWRTLSAQNATQIATLRAALEKIAGPRQQYPDLLRNREIARDALASLNQPREAPLPGDDR